MKKIRLGDCATFINGYAFKPSDWKKTGTPIVRIQDLTGSIQNPNFYDGNLDEKYMIDNGDILISWSGSLGIYEWNKEKAYLNQHIFKVKFDKIEFNKRYFVYLVKSKINEMLKNVHGSTMKHITKKNFDKIQIELHSLERQQEIAQKLDIIQETIDIRKKQIELLDELIKSQFVEMFENKKFEKTTIGRYAKFQGGYAFKSKDFVENGVKLVQISNVNKDTLDWLEINRVPENFEERYKEYSLIEDDVVMAMTRPIIKSLNEVKIAQVRKDDLPCLLNQRVGRFIITDKLDKEYLMYCCKSDKFKKYVEKMSGNSLQPNISSKQVENYEINFPPIELQNKFAEFVKLIDKQKFEIQKSLEEMEKLQESLMNKYFG